MSTGLQTATAVLLVAAVLAAAHVPLGTWMHRAFTDERDWRVERVVYRLVGVDARAEQRWSAYALSVLAFAVASVALLFGLVMAQGLLPWDLGRSMRWDTALDTAVSFTTNTNWQSYAPEAAIGSLRSSEVTFSPEDEAELEAAIEDSADRLDALIGNLLDMSRLQAGALVAHPRPVDLGEVVPGVVAAVPEPDRVLWELGPDARSVTADAGLLDRVLGNVVENALRHQQPPWRVRVSTGRLGDRVQIRVCDTGPGVPESERERIFLPFQRHGDAPAGDGVGLGLAVARGLAEAMGGSVSAEDTPGGGLTVVVELPAAEGA